MKKRHEWLILCALLVFSLSCRSARVPQTGFLNRTLTLGGTTYRYVVYVPASFDRATPSPVLLFLHGSGERGDDGLRQTEVGLGRAIRWQQERFPMIVVTEYPGVGHNAWDPAYGSAGLWTWMLGKRR